MQFVSLLLTAIAGIVIVDAILSWVQKPEQFPRSLTLMLTKPLYAPIHAVLNPQKTGGMDFSPIIILVLIQVLRSVLGAQ